MKYVIVLMRADNRGEGGIVALTVLALRAAGPRSSRWIMSAGLLGLALFYGDGVLTPSISVLSAVEGLKVATPALEPYVVPLALALADRAVRAAAPRHRRGSAAFSVRSSSSGSARSASSGSCRSCRNPGILLALNPLYGDRSAGGQPVGGLRAAGRVVLAVTGAEALYADMGHFGPTPIRRAWLRFVFPGAAAELFRPGRAAAGASRGDREPVLPPGAGLGDLSRWSALASTATVIASQAVISGAFSLTRQAVQLGYLPRMHVRHTSEQAIGQVYRAGDQHDAAGRGGADRARLPLVGRARRRLRHRGHRHDEWSTRSSPLSICVWGLRWPLWRLIPLFALFLAVDLSFFGANLLKIARRRLVPAGDRRRDVHGHDDLDVGARPA